MPYRGWGSYYRLLHFQSSINERLGSPRRNLSINSNSCKSRADGQYPRYYLAAIPEGEMEMKALALQKEFSTHITVGILAFPSDQFERLRSGLAAAVIAYLPLKLATLGESCFPEPYKSINLSIERTRELAGLSAKVFELVEGLGFTAESFEGWDYHISLVNGNYAAREWTKAEYEDACRRLSRERLALTGTARRLELWNPQFPPLKVLASFGPTI